MINVSKIFDFQVHPEKLPILFFFPRIPLYDEVDSHRVNAHFICGFFNYELKQIEDKLG